MALPISFTPKIKSSVCPASGVSLTEEVSSNWVQDVPEGGMPSNCSWT
jgi:hypothetical protein